MTTTMTMIIRHRRPRLRLQRPSLRQPRLRLQRPSFRQPRLRLQPRSLRQPRLRLQRRLLLQPQSNRRPAWSLGRQPGRRRLSGAQTQARCAARHRRKVGPRQTLRMGKTGPTRISFRLITGPRLKSWRSMWLRPSHHQKRWWLMEASSRFGTTCRRGCKS